MVGDDGASAIDISGGHDRLAFAIVSLLLFAVVLIATYDRLAVQRRSIRWLRPGPSDLENSSLRTITHPSWRLVGGSYL